MARQLFILALLLAAAACALSAFVPLVPRGKLSTVASAATKSPAFELNLTELYGTDGRFSVLHPLLNVRGLHDSAPSNACGIRSGVEQGQNTCGGARTVFPPAQADEKRAVILALLNEGQTVPEDFALRAPFTTATGESYAAMLVREGAVPYASKLWVEAHLAYFKASELKGLLLLYAIREPRFEALSRLAPDEVKALVAGDPLLLTADFLFVKDESRLGFSPLLFRAYPASAIRAALAGGDYDLTSDTSYCLERSGNVCLTYSSRSAAARLRRYSVMLLSFFALGAALVAFSLFRSLRERRREELRRTLSLQILSHEFRTPVSSLLLLLERLGLSAASFPPESQDLLTSAAAEAFRLQRVLETSKSYLHANGPQLELAEIPQLNQWLTDLALETDPRVKLDLLANDERVTADLFWLRLALVNLLRNAFMHGAQPVTLRARKSNGRIRLSVEDGGACEFSSLDAMAEPFVKGAGSEGLGLGLNITRFIVREWGSRLDYEPAPTSFSFTLGERRWPGF